MLDVHLDKIRTLGDAARMMDEDDQQTSTWKAFLSARPHFANPQVAGLLGP
jgi:hypothetical protein